MLTLVFPVCLLYEVSILILIAFSVAVHAYFDIQPFLFGRFGSGHEEEARGREVACHGT
jgi:hypothetical protein